MNKNKLILLIIAAVAAFGWQQIQKQPLFSNPAKPSAVEHSISAKQSQNARPDSQYTDFEKVLQQAFKQKQSNLQIKGSGTVSKTLPDDNKGSRHQRFILKLNSGQTLLVAHNIDLAPKIRGLKKGDAVGFFGEYEWSEQGGVIHWTHHDPAKRHEDGWLKHNGQVYQ